MIYLNNVNTVGDHGTLSLEQQKKIEKSAKIRLQVILFTFYLDFTPSARGKPLRFYWSTHSKLQIAEILVTTLWKVIQKNIKLERLLSS